MLVHPVTRSKAISTLKGSKGYRQHSGRARFILEMAYILSTCDGYWKALQMSREVLSQLSRLMQARWIPSERGSHTKRALKTQWTTPPSVLSGEGMHQ